MPAPLIFISLLLGLGALAQEPHRPAPGELALAHSVVVVTASPSDLALGRRLFQAHCALCHGAQGEGGRGPTLALPALPRATDDASLLKIITTGVAGTEMPLSRLSPPEIAHVAAFVKSLGRIPVEPVPGNPGRGAILYATKGACAQCHSLRGQGGAFGPDLTTVGQRRSAGYLRRALLEPGADVPQSSTPYRSDVSLPENFLFVRAVTREGRQLAGVRLNEDAFSIQLREVTGQVYSVFKSELAELHKDRGLSPMPRYGDTFTQDELDDLVAFLVSLRAQK